MDTLLEWIGLINEYLSVEIQLLLPAVVLVALLDMLLKLKAKGPTLLVVVSFIVAALVQGLLGDNETAKVAIKGALSLGSLNVVFHIFLREHVISFFTSFIPWLYNTVMEAAKKKAAILLGVGDIQETLIGEEDDTE